MELSNEQLSELKEQELSILRSFIQVCQQLNLKYYVLGGTLLGAVRHHGFIPWDDDIDVGMLRCDYEKFLTHGQKLLPDGLFLQTYQTDPEYPANFTKIRNSNTTFVEHSIKDRNINHGIYIDIFPLDFYPDNNHNLFDIKNLLLTIRITDAFSINTAKRKTKFLRFFTRFLYPSVEDALQKREKLFKSVKKGQYIANFCGAWGKKEIVPAHWYGDGTYLSFEQMEVTAPSYYHEWLTQVYGDYMQLPSPENRRPHHQVAAFDLHNPYTNYLEGKY